MSTPSKLADSDASDHPLFSVANPSRKVYLPPLIADAFGGVAALDTLSSVDLLIFLSGTHP